MGIRHGSPRCDQGTTGWKYSASENVHISFDVAVMSIIAQAVGEAGIPVPETKSQDFLSHLEAMGRTVYLATGMVDLNVKCR